MGDRMCDCEPRDSSSQPADTSAEYGAPTLQVQLKMLDAGLEAPSYAHPGDAGADLRARADVSLAPGERKLVPTASQSHCRTALSR